MKVIPVLDILHGEVVRGVAGRRQEYRRVDSQLTTSADPLFIAQAFRDHFGLDDLYVADLDGILYQHPNLDVYQRLRDNGFQLRIDAGLRDVNDAETLTNAGATRLIVGLESCRTPHDLQRIVEISPDVTFSLDLFAGQPRRRIDAEDWNERAIEIVHQAILTSVKSVLTLDLSDVGMGTGGSTDTICRFIRDRYSGVQLIAGGGVRNQADLIRWNQLGVDAVLVASALHDRKLCRADLTGLNSGS